MKVLLSGLFSLIGFINPVFAEHLTNAPITTNFIKTVEMHDQDTGLGYLKAEWIYPFVSLSVSLPAEPTAYKSVYARFELIQGRADDNFVFFLNGQQIHAWGAGICGVNCIYAGDHTFEFPITQKDNTLEIKGYSISTYYRAFFKTARLSVIAKGKN